MSPKMKIPTVNKGNETQTLLNGLHANLEAFKVIMIEKIEVIEKKLQVVSDKKMPSNKSEFELIRKEVHALNSVFSKMEQIKFDINKSTLQSTDKAFKQNFDGVVSLLNDNINSYFNANQRLFEEFKLIENNIATDIDSLKGFIKVQPHDPLDYLFITENFNNTIQVIKELKLAIDILIKENTTNKYQNPYICEVIFKKDLPIAEFTNYGKAIVYKDGWFKSKICFYKNNGINWIKVK